jgi:hypothetical protein
LPAVWDFINRIGRDIDVYERSISEPSFDDPPLQLNEEWLYTLCRNHRNIVQFSTPAPIAADSASQALDLVFSELIVDPARRGGHENKHSALAAVRRAYATAGLQKEEHFFERVLLQAGKHREKVDFAVTNGSALQLTQAWSFQVADQDVLAEYVKAWGWTIKVLQGEGGTVAAGDRTFDVPQNVNVAVLFIPPDDGPTKAFEDAQSVFKAVEATEISGTENAERLADIAAELLKRST